MGRPRKYPNAESYTERMEDHGVDEIVLLHEMALGNGTRKRGFILGTTPDNLETIEPADGVAQVEIDAILNNPQLFVLANKK